MTSTIDFRYACLVDSCLLNGERIQTRNSGAYKVFAPTAIEATEFPLVQIRKTAWKKALRELEWFMSGNAHCPPELLDWWAGQLNPSNQLVDGYPWQLRSFTVAGDGEEAFDQVDFVLEALRNNPHSRRILLTTWNPAEMASITEANGNPNTPTTCHGTMIQYSVSPDADGKPATLNAYHFQRSADLLLGLPHNLVQHWALLMFFAHHAGLKVGKLTYQIGDAHIYDEYSHLQVSIALIKWYQGMTDPVNNHPSLVYTPSGQLDATGVPVFTASDFSLAFREGEELSKPVTTIRPRLL
jgi:thymidylate synthase